MNQFRYLLDIVVLFEIIDTVTLNYTLDSVNTKFCSYELSKEAREV